MNFINVIAIKHNSNAHTKIKQH